MWDSPLLRKAFINPETIGGKDYCPFTAIE
jgi:hypothetical protein